MTPIDDMPDTALPRFEDRLWSELSAAHRQRQGERPAVVTPHRPNRRRRPLAVGAAVAFAAATTLVVGIAVLPGGEPRRAEASIEERIVAATDAALADSVVHVVDDYITSSEGIDHETWYDRTTYTIRSRDLDDQGAVLWDTGPAVAPQPGDEAPDLTGYDPTQVVPSDCTQSQWPAQDCPGWDWPDGYPTRIERFVRPCDATYADVEQPFMRTSLMELDLRDGVAAGWWVVDGTEVIDGEELIRLRQVTDDLPTDIVFVEQTVYVDPDTYLPVEFRSDIGGPNENILRYEYLPRTAANLALLSPPVPAGSAEVDGITPCEPADVDPDA